MLDLTKPHLLQIVYSLACSLYTTLRVARQKCTQKDSTKEATCLVLPNLSISDGQVGTFSYFPWKRANSFYAILKVLSLKSYCLKLYNGL